MRMKSTRGIIGGSLAILTGLVLLVGCGSEESGQAAGRQEGARGGRAGWQEQQEEKALSVRAETVLLRPISTYIISNTTLEAIRNVTVFSKLNAIVSELYVEEGDSVRQGQKLFSLDEREIRNEFDQARIALEQAVVTLRQAEVRSELSTASFERAKSLFEQKLTSREEYDQAELTSRTDVLELDNAHQQRAAAEARLEAAKIQLEYTEIASPISGVVTERLVDIGDRVNVNEALFTVQEFPPLWARIYVPEKNLPSLRLGQVADLEMETYSDKRFQGRIKMISPTVDSSSGTVKVTIELSQPGSLLRPGMFGTAYIATETRNDAVVVAKKAILRERDQKFVFVIKPDNRVEKREVITGFSEESAVEIVQGLSGGETIVTVGVETLSDDYPVSVQNLDGLVAPSQGQPPARAQQDRPSPEGEQGGDRAQRFQQMMQDPELRKKFEARVAEDPSIATDPQKRRAVFRELMAQSRENPTSQ